MGRGLWLSGRVVGVAIGLGLLAAPGALAAHPTGRYLVVFDHKGTAGSAAALGRVLDRTGVRKAGRGVPQLGVATVKGAPGALRALRRDPAVRSVSVEYKRDLRSVPNDPVFTQQDPGEPPGTPMDWFLLRENFPSAWNVTTGRGALVGIVDSGIDGGHPQLAGKIAAASEFGSNQGATFDADGHGTHVSGLACAATNDGSGSAGAGYNCRIIMEKAQDLRDEDIVAGIRDATNRGAKAINLSFGGGPSNAVLEMAIDYAFHRGVVLAAAASNDHVGDQGAPASALQPGDGPDINAGRGLSVTGADFSDHNALTGYGPQISVAAYGFYSATGGAPPGLISTYPGNSTPSDDNFLSPDYCPSCRTSLGGDNRYARLIGTSMATPQVTALAALIGSLNPALSAREKLRIIKGSARNSSWEPQLGWGIIDAGAAISQTRRVDRLGPSSKLRARRRVRVRSGNRRVRVRLRWSGSDARRSGLIPSGVRSFDVYMKRGHGHYKRIRTGKGGHSTIVRLRPGVYGFYTRALDFAGNREGKPGHADARVRVLPPR